MKRSDWAVRLIVTTLTLFGLCAICPLGRALVLRPLVAVFDSRYVPAHVEREPFDRDSWLAGKARHRVGMAKFLVDTNALNGASRGALLDMLGDPDVDQLGGDRTRWLLGYHAKGLFDESL